MQKYLITSREFYTDTPAVFRSILHEQMQIHRPNYVLYRDKSNPDYDLQAEYLVQVCSQFEDVKSFIHQKPDLAKELNATGVHLTSRQFDKIEYAKRLNLEVIVSTHTHEEVLKAQKLGADAVTYSPIFRTPSKGKAKGIDDLKQLLSRSNIKVFALGGVVESEQVKMLEESRVYGFASIRYFYKDEV
ncbi:MAG: thiamine phosphate synthase [Campylobacterota bacterium]|nr:thiamine phosphate synthase [Campylobacterota bacterium]